MKEWLDTTPDANVLETEYARLLGFPPGRRLEGRSLELASAARSWYEAHGRPWLYARELGTVEAAGERLRLGGEWFETRRLWTQFTDAGAHAAVIFAASAGPECEARAAELWAEEKPDEYFWMEMFGSAVVEHLVMQANARLCAWAAGQGLTALPHYSPGYAGWDVAQQLPLHAVLHRDRRAAWPSPLEVRESGMLLPKKSLLGVIGLTRHGDRVRGAKSPCANCALPRCAYRRSPYIYAAPEPGPEPASSGGAAPAPEPAPGYRTSLRALRKWSLERLRLQELPDGALLARFRYDGSTCSNLGHPLAFDYEVTLSGPTADSLIRATRCAPAPDDTGHTRMCAYLSQGPRLLQDIAGEPSLVGHPLQAVLGWERPHNPAACHCDPSARDHKWGLVLEAIHYALEQRRKSGK